MPRRYLTVALDLRWRDLGAAVGGCWPGHRVLEPSQYWPGTPTERPLVTLSVRSAFDLLLQAWPGPPGEILVGAITHPDMLRLLRHHGWTPLPIDLDPASLAPDPALLDRAVSPLTRAVLVTHLFGGRVDLSGLAPWCARRGLVLLEDCAQAFQDPDFRGHPQALASLFSFGPLKTSTALGGAVVWLRDPEVHRQMERLLATYPRQTTFDFASRIGKYALLHALSEPRLYGLASAWLEWLGFSGLAIMRKLAAGFPAEFRAQRFRLRPHRALVSLLARRLRDHTRARLEPRQRHGDQTAARMPGVNRPGRSQLEHTHWIFPVMLEQVEAARQAVGALGFEGMPGLSNLVCLEAPPDRPELQPRRARHILETSMLIPVRPSIPPLEQIRLAQALQAFTG